MSNHDQDDEPSDTNGKALESEPLVPDDAVATNPNPNNSAPADDDDDKSEEVSVFKSVVLGTKHLTKSASNFRCQRVPEPW